VRSKRLKHRHCSRREAVGPDTRHSLPIAALLGALLVTLADLAGRIIVPPLEIPAGLITALIGAPYFLYVLLRGRTGM